MATKSKIIQHPAKDQFSKIEYFKDASKQFRARIVANNGQIIFSSSESFTSLQKCKQNLSLVCERLQNHFHIKTINNLHVTL